MKNYNCPSCWAKVDIYPGIITYVCPYCNTILFFEQDELKGTGEKSQIVPFPTTLKTWEVFFTVKSKKSNDEIAGQKVEYLSEKEFNEKLIKTYLAKFYVAGHIRYLTENSMYDKFILRILDDTLDLYKNKNLIAEEDEWQIKLYYLEKFEDERFFDEIYNYKGVNKNGYFIQEKWEQKIEWFEWSFQFDILWIKTSKYLNLVWPGPKNFLIEKYNNWKILFGVEV
jgi:DNA-directed RNA polymerase subunit RPC12/RpoP